MSGGTQHRRTAELCAGPRLTAVADLCPATAQAAAARDASSADSLEETLGGEREARRARARGMFARAAGFPAPKTIDGHDSGFATGAPRARVAGLAGLAFVERAENVVLLGPSGVGKTRLAIGLGHLAAQRGWKVRSTTAAASVLLLLLLLLLLEAAQRQGRLEEVPRRAVDTYRLLVVDETGCLPMGREQANPFFHVAAKRCERGAMAPTPGLTFGSWDQAFAGEAVLAAAMLDRLLRHAAAVRIGGEGCRPKDKRRAGVVAKAKEAR